MFDGSGVWSALGRHSRGLKGAKACRKMQDASGKYTVSTRLEAKDVRLGSHHYPTNPQNATCAVLSIRAPFGVLF